MQKMTTTIKKGNYAIDYAIFGGSIKMIILRL